MSPPAGSTGVAGALPTLNLTSTSASTMTTTHAVLQHTEATHSHPLSTPRARRPSRAPESSLPVLQVASPKQPSFQAPLASSHPPDHPEPAPFDFQPNEEPQPTSASTTSGSRKRKRTPSAVPPKASKKTKVVHQEAQSSSTRQKTTDPAEQDEHPKEPSFSAVFFGQWKIQPW